MDRPRPGQSSSTKVERRVIEKNRRNQMKFLYSNLNSLLPNPNSKDLPLPDQIDEAINHIKSLETKLEKSKDKKESLLGNKRRSYTCINIESSSSTSIPKSPQIKIREMGSVLEVVLTSGLENQFIFYDIIQIFHDERADIVHASYSVLGDSAFHTILAEIEDSMFEFGAAKITERLNRLVYGSTSDAEAGQPADLWDFDISPDTWDF